MLHPPSGPFLLSVGQMFAGGRHCWGQMFPYCDPGWYRPERVTGAPGATPPQGFSVALQLPFRALALLTAARGARPDLRLQLCLKEVMTYSASPYLLPGQGTPEVRSHTACCDPNQGEIDPCHRSTTVGGPEMVSLPPRPPPPAPGGKVQMSFVSRRWTPSGTTFTGSVGTCPAEPALPRL